MLFNKENFLAFIKDIVVGTGTGKTSTGAIPADGGYNQDYGVSLGDLALGSTSVLTVDGSGLRMISTGVSSTQGSTNTFGTFNWIVPRDYDVNTDKFLLRVVAAMSGNTDTPVITAASSTILPAGTMQADGATLNTTATLVAGVTVNGSTVTSIANGVVTTSGNLSSTHAIYEFPMNGLGLVRDTEVVIKLTTGVHNTDKAELYAIEVVYASCLVGFQEAFNTSGKAVGYDAFRQEIR